MAGEITTQGADQGQEAVHQAIQIMEGHIDDVDRYTTAMSYATDLIDEPGMNALFSMALEKLWDTEKALRGTLERLKAMTVSA